MGENHSHRSYRLNQVHKCHCNSLHYRGGRGRRRRRREGKKYYPPAQKPGLYFRSVRKAARKRRRAKDKKVKKSNYPYYNSFNSLTSSPLAGSSSTVAETSRNVGAESSTTETTQEVPVAGPSVPIITPSQSALIDELVAAIKNSSGEEKVQLRNQLNDVITQISEQHELEQNAEAQLQWLSQSGKKVIKVDDNGSCLLNQLLFK